MQKANSKILIVDDDEVTRKIINFALTREGYQVYEADSPGTASRMLSTEDICLVFCDVVMGDASGFDFCAEVRSQDVFRALPFIFVTGKSSGEDKALALKIGADDFITKPFKVEDLILKTKSILRRVEIYKVYGLKEKFRQTHPDAPVKILLVDDDIIITRLFGKYFMNNGYKYFSAVNAYKGLNIARKEMPDIILSDFMMPDVDGFEFRRMLLQDPALRNIPFIFFTSNDSENTILQGFDMDIKDYILKSSPPKVVHAKINNIIKNLTAERNQALNELQEAANSISMEVVPQSPPVFKGLNIQQWHQTYKGIPGGDFIDYIQIDDDTIVIIFGDIMGKKWGAWFFAFSFIGYLRSVIRVVMKNSGIVKADEILQKVNETIFYDAKISEIFSSISLLIINNIDFSVQYSGAGDLPLILFDSADRTVKEYGSKGLLLGMNANGEYDSINFHFNDTSTLFLYTDGITESRNSGDEQFRSINLVEAIKSADYNADVIDYIRNKLIAFTGGNFSDDVSLLAISKSK